MPRPPTALADLERDIAGWKLLLPYCTWGWYDDQPLLVQWIALRILHRMMVAGAYRALADGDPWLAPPAGAQLERQRTFSGRHRSLSTGVPCELDCAVLDHPSTEERMEVFCLEQALGRHRPH
ncbi:MAG TPA: hypothetical protein VFW75_14245 [Acetobacteraceae bacterium]|nr:hypothetical protein [Acetobacteraceae bacterium]